MQSPIDIILITHNHLENTSRCIETLYRNTREAFNLTVIDDSEDATPMYFKRLIEEGDDINYVRPEQGVYNANFALNYGLGITKSDPIIFLTNSTFVEPDWLTEGLKIMERDPKVGLVGFKILFPETNLLIEAGLHVFPDANRVNIGMHQPAHRFTHIREVNAIGWAAVLIRRAAIPPEGFDNNYHPWRGVDDWDNCLEMKKRGWRIYYNGLGAVYHKLSSSQGGGTEEGRRQVTENCQRFIEKWKGKVPPP